MGLSKSVRRICSMNFFSKLKRPAMKPAMNRSKEYSVPRNHDDVNIVFNPDFDKGLQGWAPSWGCTLSLSDCHTVKATSSQRYVTVSNRTHAWQGIEQNIGPKILPNVKYDVTALVRISNSEAYVLATVKLENSGAETKYLCLGSVKASQNQWSKLQGTLMLEYIPEKVIFYLEGPPAGVDILVDSVCIKPCTSQEIVMHKKEEASNELLRNNMFEKGLDGWSARCCNLSLSDVSSCGEIKPAQGKHFVTACNRSETWQGIEQDVTACMKANVLFNVSATVRISGSSTAEVLASLYIQKDNFKEQYITIARVQASSNDWTKLAGSFTLHTVPKKAVIYIEGPAAGIDVLIDSFSLCHATKSKQSLPSSFKNPNFGINIVENSSFFKGLESWFSLGNCRLKVVSTGAPKVSPPSAKESLQSHGVFSGSYVVASNRKFNWEGPAQKLTGKIKLFLPYQVSAWVRVGRTRKEGSKEKVNVALSVDGKWVTGGEVEADERWKEICGSFRLEKEAADVFVHAQGPSAGVELMLSNLQIFPVDRKMRIESLKLQTDKIRKRDVVLQLQHSIKYPNTVCSVDIQQVKSTFPIGACINRNNLENEAYVDFFLKNFDYAVFENELKWGWVEPNEGKVNYEDADELCNFCSRHNIPIRGHCIFWEVEHNVQNWIKGLNREELEAAVYKRIKDLVLRYRHHNIQHYDVNNEILHGDFFKSRLGRDIWVEMFKRVHEIDPKAILFTNDYNVENGKDAVSAPEKYAEMIEEVMSKGGPVGGIGVQGHVDAPIGSIICGALDRLAMVGIPIWLTEIDVTSYNEYVRADDIEVVMWEAFGHPAVEGMMFWGFWEGCCRSDGHMVDVDGCVNEGGKRLMQLKEEWKTSFSGRCFNEKGEIVFRGFYGSYIATLHLADGHKIQKQFEVCRDGEEALLVPIQLDD